MKYYLTYLTISNLGLCYAITIMAEQGYRGILAVVAITGFFCINGGDYKERKNGNGD